MNRATFRVNEFYGDNEITIDFPPKWQVHEVHMEGHNDPPLPLSEIKTALQHPIGTPTIQELARGKTGRICITVEDITRPGPAHRVLPLIIDELRKGGVSDNQIFILGVFGSHHPMTLDQFARKCGWDIVRKFDVVNHNICENFDNFDRTSFGTPLEINAEFARADLRICVYAIIKHGYGGTTGSGKEVIPGVSSLRTISWNHRVVAQSVARGTFQIWKIKDNLARADMQEAARIVDINCTVNMVINDNRELVALYVGDLDEAWHAAIRDSYQRHQTVLPRETADVVVVNSYPSAYQGINWWGANHSLREGGTVIGYHDFQLGQEILQYHEERRRYLKRLQGYPEKTSRKTDSAIIFPLGVFTGDYAGRPWPVQKAAHVLVCDSRYSRRDVLRLSPKIEWQTTWNETLNRLRKIHGDEATVHVYPNALQFDPTQFPLLLP